MWPCIVTNFLIIKPTRYTNFSNLFLKWNSTCFGQFICPSSGVFHCKHSDGICHTGLLTACEQDQDGTAAVSCYLCQVSCYLFCSIYCLCVNVYCTTATGCQPNCSWQMYHIKPVWHIPLLNVQWITPDDGQRNCPKNVEFHSKINLRN